MNDIVNDLRSLASGLLPAAEQNAMRHAADEIDRLRGMLEVQNEMVEHYVQERDEARRECCRWMAEAEGGTPEEHAIESGWDCFTHDGANDGTCRGILGDSKCDAINKPTQENSQ